MIKKAGLAAASFILGILLGAAGLNIVIGRHLDEAYLEIRQLRAAVSDHQENITTLEKQLAAKVDFSVTEIRVHVSIADQYEKLELEEAVKRLLKDLRGKEVKELDPALVAGIVDKRIIDTGERKFRLTVKGTLISEKVIMYVEAREIKEIPISKPGNKPAQQPHD